MGLPYLRLDAGHLGGHRGVLRVHGQEAEHDQGVSSGRPKHGRHPRVAVHVGELHVGGDGVGDAGRDVRLRGALLAGVHRLLRHHPDGGPLLPARLLQAQPDERL